MTTDDVAARPLTTLSISWPEPASGSAPDHPDLTRYLHTVHPDDRAEVTRRVLAALTRPGPFVSPHRSCGGRVVIWVGTSRPERGGVRLDGYLVDVTDEQEAVVQDLVAEAVRVSRAYRASIERAKGIIMAEHGVDEETAFVALRRRSNEANVKLRLLAALVVRERSSRGLVDVGPADARAHARERVHA